MPKTDRSFDPAAYATVAERITLFYERFPMGRIETDLVSRADGEITFKARVFRRADDPIPAATGWASEREGDGEVNAVACLENTETSAIGRALANLGFTASHKRPSREEMEKAERARSRQVATKTSPPDGKVVSAGRSRRGSLDHHAEVVQDLLDCLRDAEGRGFPAARSMVIRSRANCLPALPLERLTRLEGAVRGWLRRRRA